MYTYIYILYMYKSPLGGPQTQVGELPREMRRVKDSGGTQPSQDLVYIYIERGVLYIYIYIYIYIYPIYQNSLLGELSHDI